MLTQLMMNAEVWAATPRADITGEATEPSADADASDEELNAEVGAATPEADITDQNDNVAAGQDKPDQPLPFYVEKEIEKLLQEDEDEERDTE